MQRASKETDFPRMENLLVNLRRADRSTQSRLLREMSALVGEASAEGGRGVALLLEHVTATGNLETSVKLLSVLGHAATSTPAYHERVATSDGVYAAAARALGKGLAGAAAVTLSCVATLLCAGTGYTSSARAAAVVRCARAHVRTSGCLNAMVQLFFRDIVYAETWLALCRCLAESCRDCSSNQTFCSRLLPSCVERCAGAATVSGGGLGATLELLLALVEGHDANRELFISCGGLRIFTREVLVREVGGKLLSAAIQGHPSAAQLAFHATLPQTLAQLITTHGERSQVGQWCSVGLYHITSGLKSLAKDTGQSELIIDLTEGNLHDTNNLYRNNNFQPTLSPSWIPNDCLNIDKNVFKSYPANNVQLEKITQSQTNVKPIVNFYNTGKKFSVMDSGCGTLECRKVIEPQRIIPLKRTRSVSNYTQTPMSAFATDNTGANREGNKSCQTSFKEIIYRTSARNSVKASLDCSTIVTQFMPLATSTPRGPKNVVIPKAQSCAGHKRDRKNSTPESSQRIFRPSQKQLRGYSVQENPQEHRTGTSSIVISRSNLIRNRTTSIAQKPIKKSLGSKLFSSFNASCTRVFQSVKNYVLPGAKVITNMTHAGGSECKNTAKKHSDHSFTEYMLNRPLRNSSRSRRYRETNQPSESCSESGAEERACRTCDDTGLLRRKLADNHYLKDTLEKLKLGIQIYGCNFKKIAKDFWPNETYITSAVLYNLYRKLIVKKTVNK